MYFKLNYPSIIFLWFIGPLTIIFLWFIGPLTIIFLWVIGPLNINFLPFIGLTMPEVLGHSILFMLVGYDTTSNALTFAAYNLATHPECQEKLIQEIDDVLGKVSVANHNG